MTVGVAAVLDQTHPVPYAFDLANVTPLFLIQLADSHEDLMLLPLICTCHERNLELVPELHRLAYLLITLKAWCLGARLQQLFEVVAAYKVFCVQRLLIPHLKLGVVPLDRFADFVLLPNLVCQLSRNSAAVIVTTGTDTLGRGRKIHARVSTSARLTL